MNKGELPLPRPVGLFLTPSIPPFASAGQCFALCLAVFSRGVPVGCWAQPCPAVCPWDPAGRAAGSSGSPHRGAPAAPALGHLCPAQNKDNKIVNEEPSL